MKGMTAPIISISSTPWAHNPYIKISRAFPIHAVYALPLSFPLTRIGEVAILILESFLYFISFRAKASALCRVWPQSLPSLMAGAPVPGPFCRPLPVGGIFNL